MKNRESIILAYQPETKIFGGDTGYIIIKQEDYNGEEVYVMIDPMHADTICKAIMAAAAMAKELRNEWIAEENDDNA